MPSRNFARAWLFAVALLGCQPGGGEVGDEVGESGTGDGDTSSGSESAEATGDTRETTADNETTADTSDTTGGSDNACVDDSDCVLVNDCCNCVAVPVGQEPICEQRNCFAPTCEASLGGFVPEAQCSVGTCQLSPISCDLGEVLCDAPEPPACEGGLVRSVSNSCYGPCVPPSLCATLPFECDERTCGEGFACVTTQSGAPSKCVPLPDGCGGVASCECVAPWFDEICVTSCGELDGTLLCQEGG